MKYFLIAGERSGDLHGSNLIGELRKIDKEAMIHCWGGDLMKDSGAKLITHFRDIQVMGIWEVFIKLFSIFSYLKKCEKDILSFNPDVVILIDFGGFNLRLAKRLNRKDLKIHYYIPPKIWAWNTSRAKKIREYIDRVYCILPFEKDFYQKYKVSADYVGNPVVDSVNNFKASDNFLNKHELTGDYIALLPGSRKQEVAKILPEMLKVVDSLPDLDFVVAGVKTLPSDMYQACLGKKNLKIIFEENYNVLKNAKAAIVTSGTATLETGLLEVPQIVVYKTSILTYLVGKLLIKVEYISLVNLILKKELVKELIQRKCNTESITYELTRLLQAEEYEIVKRGYREMKTLLGNESTSEKTARLIFNYLTWTSQKPNRVP